MDTVNEIVKVWENLEDSDEENRLFDSYILTRETYFNGTRKHARKEIDRDELRRLYLAERDAFLTYLNHRTKGPAA